MKTEWARDRTSAWDSGNLIEGAGIGNEGGIRCRDGLEGCTQVVEAAGGGRACAQSSDDPGV